MPNEIMMKDPLKWAVAQNLMLAMCIKAVLNKLDPEVSGEVARAMNSALLTDDDFLKAVAADTLERVLPDAQLKPIHDEMARQGFKPRR